MKVKRFILVCVEIWIGFFMLSKLTESKEEPSIVMTKMRTDSVANDISMKSITLNYQNNRRNIFWPYDDARSSAFDLGFGFTQNEGNISQDTFVGNHITGRIGRLFSPSHYLMVLFGSHTLRKDHDDSETTVSPLITHGLDYAYISGILQIDCKYRKDFMYGNLFLPAGVDDTLIENKVEITTKIRISRTTESSTSIKRSYINDHNQLSSIQSGISYEQEFHSIYFYIGANANYGQSRFTTPKYPSALQIVGGGPQIAANYALTDRLFISTGHAYIRTVDDMKNNGVETNQFFQIDFGDRNLFEISLSYVRMDSKSADDRWYDNQVNFSLNFSI